MIRAKVVADTAGQLLSSQLAGGLGNCSLAMDPLRLDVVEPGAFGRQKAGDVLQALFALSPATKHFSADMPLGVVPDEHLYPVAFRSQPFTHPLQIGCAYMAHWPSINKAQHLVGVVAQQSIAAYCLRVRAVLLSFRFLQAQRLSLLGPGMHPRLGKSAPPDLISVANHPAMFCSADSTSNQGVTSFFPLVLWVWGGNPVLGSLPANTQPLEGHSDKLDAHQPFSYSLPLSTLRRLVPASIRTWVC